MSEECAYEARPTSAVPCDRPVIGHRLGFGGALPACAYHFEHGGRIQVHVAHRLGERLIAAENARAQQKRFPHE